MKKVLIAERERKLRTILCNLVQDVDSKVVIYQADNLDEGICVAMNYTIDLFIVDTLLESKHKVSNTLGIEFVYSIRDMNRYIFTPIIVLSHLYDKCLELYSNAHVYKYMEKPLDYNLFQSTVKDALCYSAGSICKSKLFLGIEGMLESIYIDDIIYAQSSCHKMNIVTENRTYVVPYLTCRGLLDKIDDDRFVQCRRGMIINTDYIMSIDKVNRYITLKKCGDSIEIGKAYKNIVLDKVLNIHNHSDKN